MLIILEGQRTLAPRQTPLLPFPQAIIPSFEGDQSQGYGRSTFQYQ